MKAYVAPEKPNYGRLIIAEINRKYIGAEKIRVEFVLKNDERTETLWYQFDRKFEPWLCDDRCDTAVTALTLAAMKAGYESIDSEFPISEKLYYNLQYHVIPQLFVGGDRKISRIQIHAPLTKEVLHGDTVATGMSRGVDSFATLYEYGSDFELEEYRVNALTYFQAGAHHGYDHDVGHGKESRQELFTNQMEKTREFCEKNGYPLLVIESNIHSILISSKLFVERSFDRTHTFRNLSMAMLFQRGIRRYYYSSTYNLNDFKLTLRGDMAYYERWLIPHLSTGSIEFFQSSQDWARINKVEKLVQLPSCYDYLQVCLTKTGNCGKCMKCKRTLLELDALGDDALEKFKNSFDIERYKREDRKQWFGEIVVNKEKENSEAHYFEESFLCAAEHHPELLDNIVIEKKPGVKSVRVKAGNVSIRRLPSIKAEILGVARRNEVFRYNGECGPWTVIELEDGKTAYFRTEFSEQLTEA